MAGKAGLPWVGLDDAHGNVYQFRFTLNGKRHQGSTGKRDLETAQTWVADHYARVQLGRPTERPTKPRIAVGGDANALDVLVAQFLAYLEQLVALNQLSSSYTRKIRQHFEVHFLPRWPSIHDVLEPGAIDAWITERIKSPTKYAEQYVDKEGRKRPGRSNNPHPKSVTVHKEIVSLTRFLKWCKAKHHIRQLPFYETVRAVSDYVPPDVTADDVERLLALIPDRQKHLKRMPAQEYYTTIYDQALRSDAECGTLRWCDVKLSRPRARATEETQQQNATVPQWGTMTIRARVSKNGKPRTIAMTERVYLILSGMRKELEEKAGRVLPTALIFGRRKFRGSLVKAVAACDLPHITRHNLRHFRASDLGSKPTTAVGTLQYFLGHLHLSTTDRYVHSRTHATAAMLQTG